MDPQLPESFNHRTEKLATGRVYHFVRRILPPASLSNHLRLTNSQTTTIQNGMLLCSVYTASLIYGESHILHSQSLPKPTWYRYGWRYQIRPWVRRGYRVVVPDMLGYGGTQKPIDASEYSTKKLCADLAALLDLLEIKSAVCSMTKPFNGFQGLIYSQVIIGHDWGSFIVGRFALWHPNRILALVM